MGKLVISLCLLGVTLSIDPVSAVTCPSDTSGCDCSWTSNGANCGTDDGSECWCKCCCASQDSCNFQGGGGGGGGSSTCALPAGMDEDTLAVDSTGFATCHGKLRLGGSGGLQLVGKDGETVQLMGMSSHGLHWFPDCYSKASIQHLVEDWGINVFRAAMYIGEGGYAHDPSQKDTMLNIVQWCKELGIYVIVDWHMLSPGNPNDPEYSGADAFWTEMATKLKDETHVLFEIANEPNGVSWSEVVSYHNRIIGVIRAIDTETVILAGTPTWSQEIDQAAATPVNAPHNVMYVFHFYAGSHMSLTSRVTQYASQIPIFVSEWGSSQASGDGGPYLTEAKQFLDLFNNAGSLGVKLSWTQWSYADKAEVSAALNPGSCAAKDWGSVTCAGKFARTYIRSNTEQCGPQTSVPGATDAPPTDMPTWSTAAPTPMPVATTDAPSSSVTCPSDTSGCDCSWTSNGANCGTDDGSECWCKCCCASQDSCNFQGGGGGGGGSSTCALPAGMDEDTPAVDSTGFATCHGKLRLGGSGGLQLVGKDGETVQLMGMSSHGLHWFPDCYSKASIQHLVEDWGINVFRAAMYIGEGGYAHDPSQKDTMLNIVQWCKELGIYVIVDWHMLSPGNPNDPEYSGADAFWTEMATKLKDETHVLFEIANEPNGVSWSEVVSYHNRIIGVIRAIDTETVILAGTPTWSQEIDQAAATPVNAPHNVMYVFHFYAGSHMSLTSRVTQYASQIPIFVSEWGSSQASGDGGPYLTEAKQFLDLFNNAGSLGVKLSWTQWSYADKAEVSAALNPGSCAAKDWGSVTCAGKFARTYIRSNTEQCGPQTSVPGATDAPPTDMPTWSTAAPTPMPVATTDAPSSSVTCPSDTSGCDCSWTSNGANCGTDDGSECWCKCCCASQDSCNFQGGGGGGGGSSTCALPAGMDEDTLAVDSTGFATCHGKLRLGGSGGLQLVGKDGETVQLMGMSSHGLHWFPDCYSKASIQHLVEDWGINVFRAAMYIGEGGYAHDPSQKDTMLNIVQWCKELGIYVIVDWHMLSPGNPNDPEYSGADAFWTEMATKLKDETHVLFEIANEPNGVSWSEVVSYHNRIIGVIRAIDTETVILAGTPTWSQEIDQAAATPVNAPHNVMYVFHFYAGSHMSLTSRVTQYASQIPIFVSEWGSSQASGDGGPYLTEAKQFLDLFNNAGSLGVKLSWTQWSYADKAEVSAALNPGSCAAKDWGSVTCAGKFARTYIRSNTEQCGTMAPGTPETDAPATMAPVTVAPKTDAPSTSAPDTNAPLTTAPETRPPTTEVPATDAPKTATPTSVPAGKTLAPETTAPSTEAPLTQAPLTGAPETRPPTTEVPATRAPETATPTAIPAGKTLAPETTAPATSAPVTDAPLTRAPETRPPTTKVPVTEAPETVMPTALPVGKTLAPETTAPETRAPATSAPATDAPETVVPTALPAGKTMPPATRAPATLAPLTDAPPTRAPETAMPTALPVGKTLAPETTAPETRAPATTAPATDAPATAMPTALPAGKTLAPDTTAPATSVPRTQAPRTRAPETAMPTALPAGKTLAPETTAPATDAPATSAPATDAPETAVPTALPAGRTFAPRTETPDTSAPATRTLAPGTSLAPTTDAPETAQPVAVTDAPDTEAPATALPEGETVAPSYAPDRGTAPDEDSKDGSSFPWWGIVLIIAAVLGLIGLLSMLALKMKAGSGPRGDRLMLQDLEDAMHLDDQQLCDPNSNGHDPNGKVSI